MHVPFTLLDTIENRENNGSNRINTPTTSKVTINGQFKWEPGSISSNWIETKRYSKSSLFARSNAKNN
jgi:hypothetical protein